jgi:hypothetical protein
LPAKKLYREDDFGLAATADTGGGYALAGLQAGEWARYTIDGKNGGYFDVTVRAASGKGGARVRIMALDQTIVTADVPATGGADVFKDFVFPTVYFNPGELTLLVFVDAGGVALNTISMKPSARQPSVYPAALAHRRGVADVGGIGEPAHPLGYVRNLGRVGSSLTFGIVAADGGSRVLRLHYGNGKTKPVALTVTVGDSPAMKLAMPQTADVWTDFDVPVTLKTGANRVLIEGQEPEWNSVQIDQVELLPSASPAKAAR